MLNHSKCFCGKLLDLREFFFPFSKAMKFHAVSFFLKE